MCLLEVTGGRGSCWYFDVNDVSDDAGVEGELLLLVCHLGRSVSVGFSLHFKN